MCRLMCHPVRHISLDNKHGRQEEGRTAYGKKSSMGSENRQRSFRGNLKVLRDALNRSHLPSGWLSKIVDIFRKDCSCRRAADMQTERRRKATSTQRVPRLTQSNLGGTDRIMADFRTSVSTFGGSRSPSSSPCRTALPVRAGTELRAIPPA